MAENQVDVTRVDLVLAMRAGKAAAVAGEPATVCPHPVSGTATERVLCSAWLRGYAKAKPSK